MEKPTHYRRCHVCGYLNVVQQYPVAKCEDCGKSLAPFFYFDDRSVSILDENRLSQPLEKGQYMPIQGITVYWESF